MNQREYEERQIELEHNILLAQNALVLAEDRRESERVIARRRRDLEMAQNELDYFMENAQRTRLLHGERTMATQKKGYDLLFVYGPHQLSVIADQMEDYASGEDFSDYLRHHLALTINYARVQIAAGNLEDAQFALDAGQYILDHKSIF